MDKFKNGDVAIVSEDLKYTCGDIKVHKGSIVKIKDYGHKVCFIFRNKRNENINNDMTVPTSCLNVPEDMAMMKRMYESGVKNVSQ